MLKVNINKNKNCRFADGTFVPVGAVYGKIVVSGVVCYYYKPNLPHSQGIFVQGGSVRRFTLIKKGKLYEYILGVVETEISRSYRLRELQAHFEGKVTMTAEESRMVCPDGLKRTHKKWDSLH